MSDPVFIFLLKIYVNAFSYQGVILESLLAAVCFTDVLYLFYTVLKSKKSICYAINFHYVLGFFFGQILLMNLKL